MDEIRSEYDRSQFIVVTFGNEQYGIDIRHVDNIVRIQRITRVPKVQKYFKGVINLRGEIIPVMSIRTKMGLEEDVITNFTRIIIIKMDNSNEAVGLLVDAVKEVITMDASQIERVAYDAKEERSNFIFGVGKEKEGLISLLDLNLVLSERENT